LCGCELEKREQPLLQNRLGARLRAADVLIESDTQSCHEFKQTCSMNEHLQKESAEAKAESKTMVVGMGITGRK
jgi:hypothetical protein